MTVMIQWVNRHSEHARAAVYVALPAVVAGVYLMLANTYLWRYAFGRGLFAEILFICYLSLVVSVFQRRLLRASLLTSLFVFLFYTACLAKWLVLHESVSLFDLSSLDELLFILPRYWIAALAAVLGSAGFLLITNAKKPAVARASAVLAPLVGYAIGVIAVPGVVVSLFEAVRPDFYVQRDLNMWRNGPIFTLARQVPESIKTHRLLAQRSAATPGGPGGTIRASALPASLPRSRNLHVILMESFADPLNFRAVVFPFDPIDPRLRRWMNEGDSLALSATFGGQTARAEFEVLCGVPAYGMLGVEFNTLGGASIPCLPSLLRRHGYATIVSLPTMPSIFNAGHAYPAVGFDHSHFHRDFEMSDMDGGLWLSDVALFQQNLRLLDPTVAQGKPIFNYVVTLSGHVPFNLNPVKRPPVFAGDTRLIKLANAVHYNSAALADFVETLEARDPHAVIVVFGDHLPPLGAEDEGYRSGGYQLRRSGRESIGFWEQDGPAWLESRATPLIIRKDRHSVSVGIIPQFVIPEVILDLLSDGAYCRATDCMSRRPIIYRPNGAQAVFTTREIFPQPVCDGKEQRQDGRCAAAHDLHQAMQAAYKGMLRDGLGSPKVTPGN
jgi:hypothetical protein